MNQNPMRMNQNNQCILTEQDVVNSWLNNSDISSAIFEDNIPIELYNDWCIEQGIEQSIDMEEEHTGDDYAEKCVQTWHLPEEYKSFDLLTYFSERCETEEQALRVAYEYVEFENRGLTDVLRFLKFLTDLCKEQNIVLGVGRGSSVASYCLYLLGVHKIDSIKYNLDIKEFLK